jgi:hypothetical protein
MVQKLSKVEGEMPPPPPTDVGEGARETEKEDKVEVSVLDATGGDPSGGARDTPNQEKVQEREGSSLVLSSLLNNATRHTPPPFSFSSLLFYASLFCGAFISLDAITYLFAHALVSLDRNRR